ncbi:MAG: hypothetical protein CXZ00_03800 [Acidobacteria bacterium]|nr:MAG: hypothetical protein CXZ00_03800 [Acidobacteriota bacterium]
MKKKKTSSLRCPTCRKIVLAKDPDFPFCSDRCRVIDLGKWISEGYVISSPVNDPESGGEAEYNEPRQRRIGSLRKNPATPASADENENDSYRKPN